MLQINGLLFLETWLDLMRTICIVIEVHRRTTLAHILAILYGGFDYTLKLRASTACSVIKNTVLAESIIIRYT